MKKLEAAEKLINEALNSAHERLDVAVGVIKRGSRDSESFSTGATVTDVATAALEKAEELSQRLHELHANRKGPCFFGKDEFDSTLKSSMHTAFLRFSEYRHIVVEETSLVTNQKHMYDKEYRRLHQSLESLKTGIFRNVGV